MIEKLAWQILPDFYRDSIPADHTAFYIKKYISPDALQRQVDNDFHIYLLAFGKQPVGYLALHHQPEMKTLLLDKLYLLEAYRGQGIGTRVVDFVKQEALSVKCSKIKLVVNVHNARGIRFYERHGYTLGERFVNHFENGHSISNYYMWLCIS